VYTRKEFEELRIRSAAEMAENTSLRDAAYQVLVKADRYNWIHQTNWFGEPILQLPQDMFALQEIIFQTRPKFIVEVGVAWGGSLLFYSTLMEVLGGERIIGIDIYVPDDLRERIASYGRLSERITWINGSSVEDSTLAQLRSIVGDSQEVLVVLDSFHTHEHVLKELRLYAPLVGPGYYLACFDTYVDDIPEIVANRPRPWGAGNNPKTAVRQFLAENKDFEVDQQLENKLLLTLCPSGFLRRRKA
jgi:cephalosporin hydroxylase